MDFNTEIERTILKIPTGESHTFIEPPLMMNAINLCVQNLARKATIEVDKLSYVKNQNHFLMKGVSCFSLIETPELAYEFISNIAESEYENIHEKPYQDYKASLIELVKKTVVTPVSKRT